MIKVLFTYEGTEQTKLLFSEDELTNWLAEHGDRVTVVDVLREPEDNREPPDPCYE